MKRQKFLLVSIFFSLALSFIPLLIANSTDAYDVVILNGRIVRGPGYIKH